VAFIVIYYPEAEKEFFEAYNWYEERSLGLGKRFEGSVGKRIDDILINPESYPNKEVNVREATITDFPYLIVYKIFPVDEIILIISIFHTSRLPGKKYR